MIGCLSALDAMSTRISLYASIQINFRTHTIALLQRAINHHELKKAYRQKKGFARKNRVDRF